MVRPVYLIGLVLAYPAYASPLSGIGRSIDGDSLIVGRHEIRLPGIDAPELSQTCVRDSQPWDCGKAAADQLNKLIAG